MEISLEPDHAVGPPPVAVAACSVASDREGGASGDWHDVIALPRGDVTVVVGDGAGHGVEARPLKDALQRGLRGMAMTTAAGEEDNTDQRDDAAQSDQPSPRSRSII